jgi:hypothetical protein
LTTREAAIANDDPSSNRKEASVQGRERTKEQLYREAKRLGIKGRSKMTKSQLKTAVDRRH